MKRAQNSDSITHVKKQNPSSRTEIRQKSLKYLFLETPCTFPPFFCTLPNSSTKYVNRGGSWNYTGKNLTAVFARKTFRQRGNFKIHDKRRDPPKYMCAFFFQALMHEEHRDSQESLLRCRNSQKYYFHFFSSILHLAFWVSRFSFSKPRALLQSRRVLVTNQEKFTLKALVEIGNCHCYIEILLLYNVFCFQDQPKERRREVTWLQALWILIDLCC